MLLLLVGFVKNFTHFALSAAGGRKNLQLATDKHFYSQPDIVFPLAGGKLFFPVPAFQGIVSQHAQLMNPAGLFY